MSRSYASLLAGKNERPLMDFFLNEIYSGIDPSPITKKLETTDNILDKLFTKLDLIHTALAFNAQFFIYLSVLYA
jgi:hypothetical protein